MIAALRIRTPEEWVGVVFMTAVFVLLSIQIFFRYFMGMNFSWLEEVSRFCFVWAVYFGFIVAAEQDRHIRVSVQIMMLPPFWQRILLTVADIIWLGFNAVVIWFGVTYVAEMFQFPMISQTVGINLVWVQLIVPLGFALMSIRIVQTMIRRWTQQVQVVDTRLES